MTTATFTPAKRGDLAAVIRTTSDMSIRDGHYETHERTEVEIARVTSVTREGVVKSVRYAWSDRPAPVLGKLLLVPASTVDAEAAFEAAKQHTWPGHDDQPMPFASIEEARDFVKQFKR